MSGLLDKAKEKMGKSSGGDGKPSSMENTADKYDTAALLCRCAIANDDIRRQLNNRMDSRTVST